MSVLCLLLALVALLCALVVRAGDRGRLGRAGVAAFVCLPLTAFAIPLVFGRPPEQIACQQIETRLQIAAECWGSYRQSNAAGADLTTEPAVEDPAAPFRSAVCRDSAAELIARGMALPQISAIGAWLLQQEQPRPVRDGWLSVTGSHLCSFALNHGWIQMDELFAAYLARCRAALLSGAAALALGLLWVFWRPGGGTSSRPDGDSEAPSGSGTPGANGASSISGVRGKWVLKDGEWTEVD